MKLRVATPMSVVVDASDVESVDAEDETGWFGIHPGHADFVTSLTISVVSWRDAAGREHHVAVRGGVFTVRGGDTVEIATRQAVGEETLARLGDAVIERFREEAESERASRVSASRLEIAVLRQLQRYLDAGRASGPQTLSPQGEARAAEGGE